MWKLLTKHTRLKYTMIGEITGQSLGAFENKTKMAMRWLSIYLLFLIIIPYRNCLNSVYAYENGEKKVQCSSANWKDFRKDFSRWLFLPVSPRINYDYAPWPCCLKMWPRAPWQSNPAFIQRFIKNKILKVICNRWRDFSFIDG